MIQRLLQASINSSLADRIRDVEELTEEIELMQSANKLANQANDKLQSIVRECQDKIQYLEVRIYNAVFNSYRFLNGQVLLLQVVSTHCSDGCLKDHSNI